MIVKYNPELIKGNKRVLVVKRQSYSPNVLVMPSKGRQVSLCTDHEGYLTPKLKRWINKSEMLNGKMRYQELNTTGNAERNSIQDDDETHLYEPPPIPSNHPLKRRDSGKPYFYSNM
ncbi:hypothetical protein ABEB36_008927 [Hypothenemus hampei]|uniref:Uncharacterized protein n=1 Tax=Hypothenemus hampei TaxID=57062 RepID=A0ABD1ENJ3_HYPHA